MSTRQTLDRLQRQIAQQIPLAHAAGIRLALDEHGAICADAPFEANRNLHGTAFGGSLYVVALVCGFAQTTWLLEQAGLDADVVVHRAEASYLAPLRAALSACIEPPAPEEQTRFLDAVREHGRGRIDLTIVIAGADRPAFTLAAHFVASRRARANSGDSQP